MIRLAFVFQVGCFSLTQPFVWSYRVDGVDEALNGAETQPHYSHWAGLSGAEAATSPSSSRPLIAWNTEATGGHERFQRQDKLVSKLSKLFCLLCLLVENSVPELHQRLSL